MDIDNIKKVWLENEIKPAINEDKIRKMLDNRGKSAFNRIFRTEIIFFILLIPCIFAGIWFYNMHPVPGIIYSVGLATSFIWQWYKIGYLKKIDFTTMGILDVSKRMTKYKKYILYEIFIGAIWALLFFVSFTFYAMPAQFPELRNPAASYSLLISLMVMIFLFVVFIVLIYRFIYINNIRKIQNSIKEIQEFEKEDEL